MPLALPNLDNVTWEQLSEEARSLIPAHAPDWTNFNPSDPGITLLELLAHFTELLLYRSNRISDQQRFLFLRLINGPDWNQSKTLEEERRAALVALSTPVRAVTTEDFEFIALSAANSPGLSKGSSHQKHPIGRVKCISDRNLESTDETIYCAPSPGHVSVILVPKQGSFPTKSQVNRVKQALDTAKLVTVRVHVVAPRYLQLGLRVTLVRKTDASADWVRTAALNRLEDFFDPLRGNFDQQGWPFGRNVYLSELYQLLCEIPGVDYVRRSVDLATGQEMEEFVLDQSEDLRRQYNDSGELESIEVHDEELIGLKLNSDHLIVEMEVERR